MNIERLALDAIAGNDADIGLDTLKCVQADLYVLHSAMTNERTHPSPHVVSGFVAQIINRIDLALALAEDDDEKPEAAQ